MSPQSSSPPAPADDTIASAMHWAIDALARSDSRRLDAELLLAHALSMTRGQLLAQAERQLTGHEHRQFRALVERRAAGEPVAYLTGRREFWSLSFEVSPAVLVPRPETELLVEWALSLPLPAEARVADLGTGSGAIAAALAQERPRWRIEATDRSAAALALAARNAARLVPGRLELRAGFWCDALTPGRSYQLIVSNPPYIAADDPALSAPELRFEPATALAGGADGFAALRQIVTGAAARLDPGGWLLLEHGSGQARGLAKLLEAMGYAHVRCRTDLAGLERATLAQR